ncbi:uncharacterized protein LOC115222134 isoform X1 [Octopus sinensis]|uniref:Uncharacterized protein LOC115222134 isoform X1 n=1 Tax=Octopus sinensis TaxID=2607531 RepID=A0A6P7TDL7_9MOLL|nr:uncharacterized protein LOC115222134 isoform X1 [Octopus sinensis]XP_036367001.1 uncharacterized protein LOC115222134 isoform X1 [Octopus sinensis]XP_036367002.1 uncharacterized protein LOC115222134 isoform X1 [Octopus sinensis]
MKSYQLLQLLLVLHCYTHGFIFTKMPINVTTEKNSYVVGDSVTIYCICTDKSLLQDRNLYFFDLKSDKHFIDSNETILNTSIGKTAIILTLTNVTEGNYAVACRLTNDTDQLRLGTVSFDVGYPPELGAVWFENMDYFQLAIYVKPKKIDFNDYWKVTWTFRDPERRRIFEDSCPCLKHSCQCSNPFYCIVNENCYLRNSQYQFSVVGINFYGQYNKTYFVKSDLTSVKLQSLIKKEVTATDSSLTFSWTWFLQNLLSPYIIPICNLSYKSEWNNQVTELNTTLDKISLAKLMPTTLYTITLKCKLSESPYWSDPVTVQNRTLAITPDMTLPTLNGSYLDWKCLDGARRCLTVFWKQIPEYFPIELIQYIQVQVTGTNSNTSYTMKLAPSAVSADLTSLSKYDYYHVKISVVFRNGKQSAMAYQHIPELKMSNDKPDFITVETHNNEYWIRWMPARPGVSKNIIWCVSEIPLDMVSCKNISWVTTNDSMFHMYLYNKFQNSLSVAVSYNGIKGSSGLTQSECLVNTGKVAKRGGMPKLESPLIFSANLEGDVGLHVVLPEVKCNNLLGLPAYFQVDYSPGRYCTKGNRKNISRDGLKPSVKSVVLDNLLSDTDYAICFSIVTSEYQTVRSDPFIVRTEKDVFLPRVEGLTAVKVTNSKIMLIWKHTDTDNIITHYQISVKSAKSSTEQVMLVSVMNMPIQFKIFDSLMKSVSYDFTVVPCNMIGCNGKKAHTNYTLHPNESNLELFLTILTDQQLLVNWTHNFQSNHSFFYHVAIEGKYSYIVNATQQFLLDVPCSLDNDQNVVLQVSIQLVVETGIFLPEVRKNVTMCSNRGLKTFKLSDENVASSSGDR